MILPDHRLRARIAAGSIHIDPYLADAVQPSSLDLRLGPVLLVDTPDGWREHRLDDGGTYAMYPGAFILGATIEVVGVPPDLVGVLVGKSSRARQGLQVVSDAGYVDPGWRGNLTLEITKFGARPAILYHGMPICQLRFEVMAAPAARPYGTPGLGSHYQHSAGPVPAAPAYTAGPGVVARLDAAACMKAAGRQAGRP